MKVSDFHHKYQINEAFYNNNFNESNKILHGKNDDENKDINLKHIDLIKKDYNSNNIDKKSETQEVQIKKLLKHQNISEDFYKCFLLYLEELDLTIKDITYIDTNHIDNEESKENMINTIYRTKILLSLEKSNSFIINVLTRVFISKKFYYCRYRLIF